LSEAKISAQGQPALIFELIMIPAGYPRFYAAANTILAFRCGVHSVPTLMFLQNLVMTIGFWATLALFLTVCYLILLVLIRVVSLIRGKRDLKTIFVPALACGMICIIVILVTPIFIILIDMANRVNPISIQETSQIKVSDLSGHYSCGNRDGHYSYSEDLTVKPDGSFLWKWECNSPDQHIAQSEGTSKMRDGYLTLYAHDSTHWWRRMLPIIWGKRHYLLPETEIIKFCDAISQGAEPRKSYLSGQNLAYLKDGDCEESVEGLPSLPSPWNKLQYKIEPVHN